MLQVKDIKAGYNKIPVIRDINISAREGELIGLLGLNGTGKTTLLKTMAGLIDQMAGSILVDKKDYSKSPMRERAKLISYMPQRHSIVYDINVIDIVLMGVTPYLRLYETPNKRHRDLAYRSLEKIGMEAYAKRSFLQLSEGQKQLILIARTLVQDSKIMLFDEPDSALDFNNKHMVLNKIRQIIIEENKIGFITLHDPNFALEYCQKILIIDGGEIISEFYTDRVSQVDLKGKLGKIYDNIEVLTHRDKYFLMRANYEA